MSVRVGRRESTTAHSSYCLSTLATLMLVYFPWAITTTTTNFFGNTLSSIDHSSHIYLDSQTQLLAFGYQIINLHAKHPFRKYKSFLHPSDTTNSRLPRELEQRWLNRRWLQEQCPGSIVSPWRFAVSSGGVQLRVVQCVWTFTNIPLGVTRTHDKMRSIFCPRIAGGM